RTDRGSGSSRRGRARRGVAGAAPANHRRCPSETMPEVFNTLVDAVSGAWWSYFIVFGVAMVDAFFPLVPSETVAITAGVLAGSGNLSLPLCILAASAGAFAGDNICYGLGTLLGGRAVKRFFLVDRTNKGFDWA